MLIEIHAIQNHSPANLNRDDLGAPKTCFFGGVLRSRISSQCIKRSIRLSDEFKLLCGAVRTRRLPKLLAERTGDNAVLPLAQAVVQKCGINRKEKDTELSGKKKDVIVFVSEPAVSRMVDLLSKAAHDPTEKDINSLAGEFARLIAEERFVPDMALAGRMLEPAKPQKSKKEDNDESKEKGVWNGHELNIEAALQVAHAISTHEARPEVDYFVAADDVKDSDAGGAHIGEALYSSACFYKYFSINWDVLVSNLNANKELAAHTVGAFIRGAALTNPSGKQNSFAAHNLPEGIAIEIKEEATTPTSYANAFAAPVPMIGERDVVSQSIAQLAQYARDLDVGYGIKKQRHWFSPNLRHTLKVIENRDDVPLSDNNYKTLDELVVNVVESIGFEWEAVQKSVVNSQTVS